MTPDRTPTPSTLPTQHETDPVLVGAAELAVVLFSVLGGFVFMRLVGVL